MVRAISTSKIINGITEEENLIFFNVFATAVTVNF